MRITVDPDVCSGHGRCNAMAPEVYQLDDMAHCFVRDMEVPAGLEDKARLGAASCPERAITVHE